MPTPPPRRRNPAVSIRRVQSERKYLTPWGGPPVFPTWKYKYDYARRTAIIPPLAQPHMIGTSQGFLGRGIMTGPIYPIPHSLSEAHLQPLILVAPPLIVGAYPPPRMDFSPPRRLLTEDEILAQERINAFLKEAPPSHRPRSLLSYPESHLYESLISQISDEAKDEISIGDSHENIYQKLTKGSKENKELVDSFEKKHASSAVNKENNIGRINSSNQGRVGLSNLQFNENFPEETKKEFELDKSALKTSIPNCQNFEKSENKIKTVELKEINLKERENVSDDKRKSSFLKNSFVYNIHKTCSKIYLKSFFRTKKKYADVEKEPIDEIQPTPMTVSIVHINNDSGIDEVSVKESVCFKCDGSLSSRSRSDKCTTRNVANTLEKRFKTPKKSLSLDFTKNFKLQRSSTFTSMSKDNLYFGNTSNKNIYQHAPIISRTVELPESVPHKICFANDKKTDIGIQVTSEDIARSQNGSDSFLTLDPLKPSTSSSDSGLVTCTSCLNHKRKKASKLSSNLHHERCHKRISKSSPMPKQYSKQKDIAPLIVDFGSESEDDDNNNDDVTVKLHMSSNLENNRKNNFLSENSADFKYSFNSNANQEALVYVYRPPLKSSEKSSCVFSSVHYKEDDYSLKGYGKNFKNNLNRRGGSSGLGSSGSETSYDETCTDNVNRSPNTKPSEKFLATSLGSSFGSSLSSLSSLRSTKGRPCFDYSWSWSHLNELVRKVPSISSSRRKASPSLGSMRKVSPSLGTLSKASPSLGSLRMPSSSFKDIPGHFEASSRSGCVV